MGKKIGIAALIMTVSVFLSRALGLVREMAIAFIGGAGTEVDSYQVAFVIPEILNHVAASGFLSISFIPIFSRHMASDREDEGWRIFSIILNGFGTLLLLLTAVAWIGAAELVSLIAPGITDPAVQKNAVRMTRIIMPAQLFFFAGGLFMAVQFAKQKFFIPALAPLLYSLGIIAGGLLLGPYIGMEGFSWGVLGGAFSGNFALQYYGAKRVGLRYFSLWNIRHPEFIRYLRLTLPLMLGLTMMFSTEVFFKYFGSYLPPGGIAGLNYGLRIMLSLVGVFGQAAGMAAFPFLARLAAEDRMREMNGLLNATLRYLLLIVPFSVLLLVLRREIVLILFQRGRFDAAATALTAELQAYLLLGAFAFSAQTVVARGFYAVQNTLLPAVLSTAAVFLSIPIYLQAMKWMGAPGVALAVSISAIFQVALLYEIWNRYSGNTESRRVYCFFVRILLASAAIGIVLYIFHVKLLSGIDASGFSGCLIRSLLTAAVFAILLVGAGYLFKIDEIREVLRRLLSNIKGVCRQFLKTR